MSPPTTPRLLSLFPLQTVLFPGGLLNLKVFEPRYLDLMAQCMRQQEAFGVICLRRGREVGTTAGALELEEVGVMAHLEDVDAEQAGILRVRAVGGLRFRLQGQARQTDNGLWQATVKELPPDTLRAPGPAVLQTVNALAEAIKKLREQDQLPFRPPYKLDESGWVANRWCELLPIPLAAKQKLMELDDPVIRLSLVDGFLRDKKVVIG